MTDQPEILEPLPEPAISLNYASPIGVNPGGIWREGDLLVTTPVAALPQMCVKCNEAADGSYKNRKYAWSSPWWAFLILAGILVYAIVVIILQKKATITVGLCRRHQRKRTLMILATFFMTIACVVSLPVGVVFASSKRSSDQMMGIAGIVLFFVLLISAIIVGIKSRPLRPAKIDAYYARFKGCGPDFLANFSSTR